MQPTQRILLATVLCCGAVGFLLGVDWGLPSRAADPYLFGDRPAWTGQQILALSGGWGGDTDIGADVDLDPLAGRDRTIVVNETDPLRAEIVQRYRIQSHQPDEHITFRALARMNPGGLQLDPGLYQYGGLWIYPVGALLKVASVVGLVDLRSDVGFYLDHPEAFGRFYVVARLYSAAWGVVATWAAFCLTRRLAGCGWAGLAGAACFAAMPVVVNMAHEAKPHVPGLALMLLTVLAACRYVESGNRRWAWAAGALAGAAFGMVISSLVIFCVLPVMAWLRPGGWAERARIATLSVLLGVFVYVLTNPFVPINAIWNPKLLASNLGTSTAMYQVNPGGGALGNAARLIGEGTSPVAAAVGALVLGGWAAAFATRRRRSGDAPNADTGLVPPGYALCLLGLPALVVLLQFVALGGGKPGEYARFALLPDTVLMLAAVAGAARLPWRRVAAGGLCILFVTTAGCGAVYLAKFIDDRGPRTTRFAEADRLRDLHARGAGNLLIIAEPAPYCLPPVNLFDWHVKLAPRGGPPTGDVLGGADAFVRAVDRRGADVPGGFVRLPPVSSGSITNLAAPISWAAKPFEIWVKEASRALQDASSPGSKTVAPGG